MLFKFINFIYKYYIGERKNYERNEREREVEVCMALHAE